MEGIPEDVLATFRAMTREAEVMWGSLALAGRYKRERDAAAADAQPSSDGSDTVEPIDALTVEATSLAQLTD